MEYLGSHNSTRRIKVTLRLHNGQLLNMWQIEMNDLIDQIAYKLEYPKILIVKPTPETGKQIKQKHIIEL